MCHLLVADKVATVDTYSPGGDKTDFLAGNGATGNGGRLANVLVVTTTVRMVNGVHCHTTSARPAIRIAFSSAL